MNTQDRKARRPTPIYGNGECCIPISIILCLHLAVKCHHTELGTGFGGMTRCDHRMPWTAAIMKMVLMAGILTVSLQLMAPMLPDGFHWGLCWY